MRRVEPPAPRVFDPVPHVSSTLAAPVSDAEYRVFESLHRYDASPLDSRIERTVDDSLYWRRETVSFGASYGNERVLAHLFLPKGKSPPYQAVITLGASGVVDVIRRIEDFNSPFEFLVRSGRAVVIPVLSGTLERGPSPFRLPANQERERALRWSADIGRTLEYLDTRGDFDQQRLGLYGVSSGAVLAVRLLPIYPRFGAAVLSSGGFYPEAPAEVNSWHFAPRVRTPVLMVNGRYDFRFHLDSIQRPLFKALGTKEPDKRHVLFDGGHRNLVTRPDLLGEVLDWFDRYLGPVQDE
jgi:dienelactone hydrolase